MNVTILAIGDVVWQAIIAAIVTLVLAWMNNRTKDAVIGVGILAINNKEDTDKKLDIIHALGNSQMGAQKRLLATTARAKAHITKDEIDIKAADNAEKELTAHEARQAVADKTKEKQE